MCAVHKQAQVDRPTITRTLLFRGKGRICQAVCGGPGQASRYGEPVNVVRQFFYLVGSGIRTMSHCCVWPSAKWINAGAVSCVRLESPVSAMGRSCPDTTQATR